MYESIPGPWVMFCLTGFQHMQMHDRQESEHEGGALGCIDTLWGARGGEN